MDTVYQLIDLFGRPVAILLTFLLVVFLVVRPGMELLVAMLAARKRRRIEEEHRAEQAAREEELLDLLRQAGPDLANREQIEEVAKTDPDRAISMLRTWLRQQDASD